MSGMDEPERRDEEERAWGGDPPDDLERASENVLEGWPSPRHDDANEERAEPEPPGDPADDTAAAADPLDELVSEAQPAVELSPLETSSEHVPGILMVPPGYAVLEGEARGGRRAVGIVVSRFNGDVTGKLLESALAELEARGVEQGSITVMPVPGAFELPIAAMALAKTRRFACVVALGCVIRGDTPHFDYVASEAASGLQLAAIETGVPVAFGVLTLDRPDQAGPRVAKGAEAVRSALEMADLFSNLRAAAAR
jgi:6,7-dimethyl-8-ribityllumazine synthase